MSHKLSAALGTIPAGGTLDLAIQKLSAGLPRDAGLRLADLLRRVVVGRPPSAALCAESGSVRPSVYAACEGAFVRSCELDLVYVDAHGATSQRRIQPHGLLIQAPLWYLLAWDPSRQGGRMFRLDRIQTARALESRAFEPLDPRALFAEIGRFGLELC
ncbi:MAG: WYL domain-containing protein [Acidobacteria bacterium]|nr:WYL domain-containing protein [Acidobacteriota bacterium]MBI3486606.1 WYL domain-containing protein [Acidobacteriota bacterium]